MLDGSNRIETPDVENQAFFATYAPMAQANGYSVIGLQPGSKTPLLHTPWQNFCWNRSDMSEIEWIAQSNPNAGVGLACGSHTMAFDIDVADEDAAQTVREMVEDICGPTPLIRVGQAPKLAMIYRSASPIIPIRLPIFDILGMGCQLVGYGQHPKTGGTYNWIGEGAPHLTQLKTVPTVSQEQCIAVSEAYMRALFGQRFQRIIFDIDMELASIALSSRSTLFKQLATCLFRGKAAAQTKIRNKIRRQELRAGLWGCVMRAEIEGCDDNGDLCRQMSAPQIIEILSHAKR
ncbi:bifunctional DNA primase/polymerase [Halovulum sp. GXIMD14793]